MEEKENLDGTVGDREEPECFLAKGVNTNAPYSDEALGGVLPFARRGLPSVEVSKDAEAVPEEENGLGGQHYDVERRFEDEDDH